MPSNEGRETPSEKGRKRHPAKKAGSLPELKNAIQQRAETPPGTQSIKSQYTKTASSLRSKGRAGRFCAARRRASITHLHAIHHTTHGTCAQVHATLFARSHSQMHATCQQARVAHNALHATHGEAACQNLGMLWSPLPQRCLGQRRPSAALHAECRASPSARRAACALREELHTHQAPRRASGGSREAAAAPPPSRPMSAAGSAACAASSIASGVLRRPASSPAQMPLSDAQDRQTSAL
jgi:hypothetical protein